MTKMKKLVIFLLFLSSLVFFSSAIFAQTCNIVQESSCTSANDYVLMKLSGETNAHGALPTDENYNYVVCCDFSLVEDTFCAEDKVLGLSSDTNAHAEIPSLTTYSTQICYEGLSCVGVSDECDADHPIEVLSLSGTTNAHIGAFGDYDTKICCSASSSGTVTSAIWTKNMLTSVSTISIVPDNTEVRLLLRNYDVPQGTEINFKIKEKDNLMDDEVPKTITAQVDANKRASATWKISQNDLNEVSSLENEEDLVFYFEAYSGTTLITTSGDLGISEVLGQESCQNNFICGDYTQEDYCISDICSTLQDSVPIGTDCTGLTACFCSWDSEENVCDAIVENLEFDENGVLQSLGQCIIKANKNSDPEGCEDDNQITYSWTSTWSGDPLERPESCTETGGYTLSCPSEVQLPFFGFYNFIIALIFVMGIYLILGFASKRKKRHGRK